MVSRKQALATILDISEDNITENQRTGVVEEFTINLTAFGSEVDVSTLADGAMEQVNGAKYLVTFHRIDTHNSTVIVSCVKT